jgi:hypothetical protein
MADEGPGALAESGEHPAMKISAAAARVAMVFI